MSMIDYKRYSLEQLENWVHDVMSSDVVAPEEIYDTILSVVEENYHIYKEQASKASELLALLNGNGQSHEDVLKEREYYESSMPPWGHSDLEYGIHNSFLTQDRNSNFPKENTVCDKDDPSPECKSAWNSFWYDNYDPNQYTEQELNAMCDKAELDAEIEKIKQEGGYGWTPEVTEEKHSKYYYDYTRNDIDRKNPFLKNCIYESPNGGKTIYSREFGKTEKTLVKDETPKKWILPVEQSVVDGVDDYYVSFPDDLLEAANLKEGDKVEWIDNGNGSYTLRKIVIAYHPV